MLQLSSVSVAVGKRQILSDVSLEAVRGEFLAVVGRNGSGKTTLLRAIAGILPYGGSIALGGETLRGLSPRDRARRIALMPQLLPHPRMTVAELLALGRTPYLPFSGSPSEPDHTAMRRAAEQTELTDLLSSPLDTLSGGELRRAYLGMVLAQDTPLVLLDEATAYLDGAYEAAFLNVLSAQAHEGGKTVIAVLHDLSDAVRFADRIAVMHNGRLIVSLPTEELLATQILEKTLSVTRYTATDESGKNRIFFK